MNPRERVAEYLSTEPGVIPLSIERDMRAVLAANAGYEQLMRDAAKEAVAECKRELAKAIRERAEKVFDHGAYHEVINIADDLEDGTL